jgi:hypothetical protein
VSLRTRVVATIVSSLILFTATVARTVRCRRFDDSKSVSDSGGINVRYSFFVNI